MGEAKPRPTYQPWAALTRYDRRRDAESGFYDSVLPAELGTVHAFGAVVRSASREPEFFDFQGPFALCGDHVKVRLPVLFDVDDEDGCAECAALVAAGVKYRRPPDLAYECGSVTQPDLEGFSQVVSCYLPARHAGPHRTAEGATWVAGQEDFTPERSYPVDVPEVEL